MVAKIKKQDFRERCWKCADSLEPGWLYLGKDDWLKCPFCTSGFIEGVETRIEPTRKIYLGRST